MYSDKFSRKNSQRRRRLWQGFNRFFTCISYSGDMKRDQKTASVQDIMAQMAGRMDSLLDASERTRTARETGIIPDELRFWMAVDPLLADLHKQFLDARANHIRLTRLRGAKDPMADVANDMADSAQCAFETRLLELRRDEDSKAMVLALMRRAHQEHQRDLSEQARVESAAFWRDFSRPKAAARTVPERGTESFMMVFVGLLVLQEALKSAEKGLASVFRRASHENDDSGFTRERLASC